MGSERCKGNGVGFDENTTESTVELDIPEWLLIEVLIRLPVKMVFRVKLVCRTWLSVISDPFFIRRYVSRASLLQTWTFISPTMPSHSDRLSSLDKDRLLEDVHCQDLKFPSLYVLAHPFVGEPDGKKYRIVDVSDGLVLYAPRMPVEDCYSIYSPTTRQWIALPLHARPFVTAKTGFVTHVEDGVLKSYRVVRLEMLSESSDVIRFEVFISEIGEWKQFTVYTDHAIKVMWRGRTAVLDGILHWITRENWIIAYDPFRNPECVRFIALPSDEDENDNDERCISGLCSAHQGRLRYFKISDVSKPPHGFSSFGVWILNDYGTGDWCLQHRISSADVLFDDVLSEKCLFLVPISFHPFDPDIVYMGYGDIIVSYNIKTRKLEGHRSRVSISLSQLWWRAILFVIPTWPISIMPSSSTGVH